MRQTMVEMIDAMLAVNVSLRLFNFLNRAMKYSRSQDRPVESYGRAKTEPLESKECAASTSAYGIVEVET